MSEARSSGGAGVRNGSGESQDTTKEKGRDVRVGCITAAKAVADAVRTSLGPRGMDKMIVSGDGEVVITNDGATIMDKIKATHPAAKMLVELSKAQDIEAGDGTTSVVVIAGALLDSCLGLLARGIHPTIISESYQKAAAYARNVLQEMSIPVSLEDRESLLQSALTSLNSKVVSQYSNVLAPIAVDAVLRVIDPKTADNVELKDIRIVCKLGETLDSTELVDGLVFPQKASHKAGGPNKVNNAKVLLIQYCLSAPKTDMDNQVVVSDYAQMDRLVKEERKYILNLCKQIKATGANVLLVQKSILRDALSDLALHFLAKMDIMVVRDVERNDIEFICKGLGCLPVATPEGLSEQKLGHADLVTELPTGEGKIVKMTGIPNKGRVVSVLIRGSNKLVLGEAERSLHDALCVVRSLVKKRFMICGGGAPEIEVSVRLMQYANTLSGVDAYCIRAYAEALEVVPVTLAENAGLHAIGIVTDLRNRHVKGEKNAGVNVKKGGITDMRAENVIQPLLVSSSALSLATETVQMILKIDDIVDAR